MRRFTLVMPLLIALAACGGEQSTQPAPERDPQVAQALDDPLMTDPDLSSRNEAASALTVESDASLPVLPATSDEILRAKAEAAEIVGGEDKLVAPGPPDTTSDPLEPDANPAQRLAARLPNGTCSTSLASSAMWAARLPVALPIYPRGHTLDAAGSDAAQCKIRTVAFTTPVPREDVLAFYLARVKQVGGKVPSVTKAGGDIRLSGQVGVLIYDIFARTEGDHTLVRLTTIER